jgi:hypothetical protein
MPEQRKATDVVLAIEGKVDALIKILSSYDHNMKLVLDRVNKVYSYVEEVKQSYKQQDNNSTEEAVININDGAKIEISEKPIVEKRNTKSASAEQSDISINPMPYRLDGFDQRVSNNVESKTTDKKVPVIQRVTDQNGKDIFMADITVFNDKLESVYKTKSNAVGKWQAHLKPGRYTVSVSKTDMASKKKLEVKQDITIPQSNATITLDILKITR